MRTIIRGRLRPAWGWYLAACSVAALLLNTVPASAQAKLASECEAGAQAACVQLARSQTATTEVRLAAVRKLTDQQVLLDLATTCSVRSIRVQAIRGLIDDDAIADLARHAKGPVERGAAIERVKSQELLSDIARKDPSKWVRRKAANWLTDQAQVAKLVAEGRRELLPTVTFGAGIRRVKVDDKDVNETLLGVITLPPGRHTVAADFQVKENVSWEPASVTSTVMEAKLGAAYLLEAEIGVVTWEYLSPRTRHGRGTWKLVVREEVSSGPDLLPQLLKR
jgi:hypothetical protein